ncbi:mechanosensitive ion channel family protein [Roseicella sp. DB1501]|uniref:mechanosensitive ion channel family protein n=1 Tax=Roseicella sp. DB1501 TaxID=2730925 RepID=UPI001492F714|nr:mechanosensitive ion channel domain-containing protein [Roseicella sp. DB1501]NOG71292.1 mechanosensitive ion channel [Roseicella sp. DB1501]
MSGLAPRLPAAWPLALLALLAGGLWLAWWGIGGDAVLGHGPVQLGLRIAAVLATALLAVLAGGRLVLGLGLSATLGVEPTGLQRAIAYALLTFAASAAVLASFGLDITAVLTTSAILTAAVGLAMQPTLGSLISGLALHMDRVLRVGDAVVLDGDLIEIVRLDWRTAVGRRRDGALLVIPNARISNETLVIHQGGRPIRSDVLFHAPAGLPAQRVTDLVTDLIADFPQVDAAMAVMVMVDGQEPEHAAIRYRARYWVRQLWDRPEMNSEVLRRILYAFRREGIPLPASRLALPEARQPVPEAPGGLAAAVAALLPGTAAQRLAEGGRPLLYAPDERLILPAACEGWALLLLAGRLRPEAGTGGLLAGAAAVPPLAIQRLGRAATLRRTADALAQHIGPFAEHAVHRLAAAAPDLAALRRQVAREIEDPARRARFLAEVGQEEEPSLGAGSVLRARRDATGRLAADPPVRAATEALLLAVPPALAALLPGHPGAEPLVTLTAALAETGPQRGSGDA